MESKRKEPLRNRSQLYFDMVVYHTQVYKGEEPLRVVGIRKDSVELYGDYSGMGNSFGTSWLPLDGVLIEEKDILYRYYGSDMVHRISDIKNNYIDTKENILNNIRGNYTFVEGTTEEEIEAHVQRAFKCYTTKMEYE